jgi:hypothetical protein
MDAADGVIETVGGVTVRAVLPVNKFPHFAAIAVKPPAIPTASPVVPTVATAGLDEFQVTEVVTFKKLPSL